MNSPYYAEACYDSSRVKGFPLPENSKFSATARRLRKNPISRHASAQCGEFFSVDDIEIIELLNSKNKEEQKDIASPGHEMQQWETLRNPKALVDIITQIMWFFSLISWVVFLILVLMGLFKWPELKMIDSTYMKIRHYLLLYCKAMVFPIVATAIYFAGKLLLKYSVMTDKNNIVLNRRKGIVICPGKKNPNLEIPFEEFDPYLNHSANSSGRIGYHLTLHHRYSEEWISYPEELYSEWEVNQAWEFWQQYMDVSKPLPDTPKMEPFRSRDPVTAAYDKQHQRPPDYWKNMDPEKADKMQDAAMAAASRYPWGATREQALAQGWQPSGFGQGDWREDQTG